MLSSEELRKFIEHKRLALQQEKDLIGISPRGIVYEVINQKNDKPIVQDDDHHKRNSLDLNDALVNTVHVKNDNVDNFKSASAVSLDQCRYQCSKNCKENVIKSVKVPLVDPGNHLKNSDQTPKSNLSDYDITRILRKEAGLPINMLKTGEFSPNNPLVRQTDKNSEIHKKGDIFLGLGEYEERRKKLMKLRQMEYKEYLDKQNELRNKTSLKVFHSNNTEGNPKNVDLYRTKFDSTHHYQNGPSLMNGRLVSVGVQTDLEEITSYRNANYTRAEKELSPRPVERNDNTDWNMTIDGLTHDHADTENTDFISPSVRSIHDSQNEAHNVPRKDSPRDRLLQDLRHTYMPSLFDADTIKQRNIKAEEEAMAKRLAYQEELKKQIAEQQRIKEERKAREKMLEEAEARRLEQQLKCLKEAQDKEIQKQKEIGIKMHRNTNVYNTQRKKLQNEIEFEKKSVTSVKANAARKPFTNEQRANANRTKLPFYYPSVPKHAEKDTDDDILKYKIREAKFVEPSARPAVTTNIPGNSKFAQYVKNGRCTGKLVPSKSENSILKLNGAAEKVQFASAYEPNFLKKNLSELIVAGKTPERADDYLPVPVSKYKEDGVENRLRAAGGDDDLSDDMKTVVDKWQVPAVQKNILKSGATGDGKMNNILTQLGSIRRQLQLEQMRLDQTILNNRRNASSSIR